MAHRPSASAPSTRGARAARRRTPRRGGRRARALALGRGPVGVPDDVGQQPPAAARRPVAAQQLGDIGDERRGQRQVALLVGAAVGQEHALGGARDRRVEQVALGGQRVLAGAQPQAAAAASSRRRSSDRNGSGRPAAGTRPPAARTRTRPGSAAPGPPAARRAAPRRPRRPAADAGHRQLLEERQQLRAAADGGSGDGLRGRVRRLRELLDGDHQRAQRPGVERLGVAQRRRRPAMRRREQPPRQPAQRPRRVGGARPARRARAAPTRAARAPGRRSAAPRGARRRRARRRSPACPAAPASAGRRADPRRAPALGRQRAARGAAAGPARAGCGPDGGAWPVASGIPYCANTCPSSGAAWARER